MLLCDWLLISVLALLRGSRCVDAEWVTVGGISARNCGRDCELDEQLAVLRVGSVAGVLERAESVRDVCLINCHEEPLVQSLRLYWLLMVHPLPISRLDRLGWNVFSRSFRLNVLDQRSLCWAELGFGDEFGHCFCQLSCIVLYVLLYLTICCESQL